MNNLKEDTQILFDGIPRKVKQANLLNEVLKKHNRTYQAVLLDIKKETALHRLTTRRICKNCKAVYPVFYDKSTCEKCGGELITRADDNESAIKTRLDAYETDTIPAINLYKDMLIVIDGEPSIEEVQKLAFKKLDPIMK